jgi:beta-lactamase class A
MRRNLIACIIVGGVGALGLAVPARAEVDAGLQSQLEAMARQHHGKLALYATSLDTGQSVAVDADVPVVAASVIKLTLLVEAMEQVKAGRLRLSDRVTMGKRDIVPGAGILQFFDAPLTLTFKDVLTVMLIESDNTATNLAIDQVGLKAVNERSAALGLKDTYFYKKLGRPSKAPMPPDQPKFGLGKTTAREMTQVLESIVRCQLGAPKLCDLMVDMLVHQKWRNSIPHYLGADSSKPAFIANKTGAMEQVRNDVGVVYSKAGPILISAFTYENEDTSWNADNDAELLIARIAKVIVDAWSPSGLAETLPRASGPSAGPGH